MRAITICQPYASLIANPPHVKRIENRTWPTRYRGDIAIHAGKSTLWIRTWSGAMPRPMPFGAIVAVARLYDCLELASALEAIARGEGGAAHAELLIQSDHAGGPFCWMFDMIRPLAEPVYCPGAQGMWFVPPRLSSQFRYAPQPAADQGGRRA